MVAIDGASRTPTRDGSQGATARALPGQTSPDAHKLPWPVGLYLIVVFMPMFFSLGPLSMTPLRMVVLVATVPLAGMLLTGRFGRLVWSDYFFLAHLAWIFVALAVNNPDRVIENFGSNGIEFLGGYLMGRAMIRTRGQFIALAKWLATATALLLPMAVFEALTGRPILLEIIRSIPAVNPPHIGQIDQRLGLDRVQGFFAHPIHFGLFCSIIFSLTFVGLKGVYSDYRRWITSAAVGICTFLALSSGALLALMMQLFFITWFAVLRNFEKRWWLLFWLCVAAYVVVDIASTRTPIRVFMSYATFSAHNAFWRGIIFEWGVRNVFGSVEHNVPASVWVGIGLNDWIRPPFMRSSSVDNFWLLTLMLYGLPGLLFLVVGYVGGIIGIIRRKFDGDEELQALRRAWVFTFLGLSFTMVTVHVWSTVYSFVFFMFGAGLWMLQAEPRNPDAADGAPLPDDTAAASRHAYSRFTLKTRGDAPEPTTDAPEAGPPLSRPLTRALGPERQ